MEDPLESLDDDDRREAATPDPAEQQLRHDLAASWATAMLARHPSARSATVWVEAFEVPSMSEYRADHRPRWVRLFSATFTTVEAGAER